MTYVTTILNGERVAPWTIKAGTLVTETGYDVERDELTLHVQSEDVRPQRQDSLEDQLRDVEHAAVRLGCYDAHDWIRSRTRTNPMPTTPPPGFAIGEKADK